MNETGQKFIARSRYHLVEDFLPKIERCTALLSDEQIWWRPNAESNSIGNLLLHLSGNARQWIVCGLGDAADQRDRDSEFAQRETITRDELLARIKQTISEVDATLARFDSDQLLEKRRIQGLEVTALDAILHVVEHFSMHAGQIIFLTKLLTAADLHFYEFEGDAPLLRFSSRSS
jgi:uncharacterized damage-inducible protein DinB